MERVKLSRPVSEAATLDTNFNGASVITASGQEIPITEQMLQNSFNLLIDAWENSRKKAINPVHTGGNETVNVGGHKA